MHYTYVLLCRDVKRARSEFYIGSTDNLDQRIAQHRGGQVQTTKRFDTIELAYYESCISKTDARRRELQLKTGFGRGYLKRRLAEFLKTRV
jgi:putative endonuclease